MKKLLIGIIMTAATVLVLPAVAFAHVVVTPNQVDVGARAMFNVSVPNEKEVAVTSVKLSVPKGVENVSPDVMGGWKITTEGTTDNVTSITWTGNIPVGQRADFTFRAQAPANSTELNWKAYQTYANGTIVHWDQTPTSGGDKEGGNAGPYSVTKVADDLTTSSSDKKSDNPNNTLSLIFSIAAIIISVGGLLIRKRAT